MFVAVLIVTASVLYILYLIKSNKEFKAKLSKVQSDPALPILGHFRSLGRKKEDLLPALERMWRKFDCDKFLLKIGPIHQVVLTKPCDVEVILSSSENINKNIYYKCLKDMTGNSIVVTDANRWRPIRKVWASAFNYKYLEAYVHIFRDEINDLLVNFHKLSNMEVNIFPLFNKSILRATCRISLGFDTNTDKGLGDNCHTMLDITSTKIFSFWKSVDFLYNLTKEGQTFKKSRKLIEVYLENSIKERRHELKLLIEEIKNGKANIESVITNDQFNRKQFNFLSHLLLTNINNEFLNDEDIRSELITFILAGHETTSIASSFTAYCLALNPQIQENVYQEQLSISGGNLKKPITFQDLTEMKYLECVIKETMRLYPPIMFFGRRITKEVTLPDGVELPADCNVMFMPYLTHKIPDVFPEPDKFNPDRFLFDHPSQYSYFPLSAGPRNCVGGKLGFIESKFYLASTIRAFAFLPPLGEHPKLIVDMSLNSSTGINVRLRKRN